VPDRDEEQRLSGAPEFARLASDVVMRAGAGTGKTHSLTTVVLHTLAGATTLRERLEPREITALTFTDLAAAEMRQRIRARVAELAVGEACADRVMLGAASQELRVDAPDSEDWARILERLPRMRVSTFHGWALAMLRAHAAEAGIDPAVAVLEEEQATDLWRSAAQQVLIGELERLDSGMVELVAQLGWGRRDARHGDLVAQVNALIRKLREQGEGPELLTAGGRFEAAGARARRGAAIDALRGALRALGARIDDATATKRELVADMGRLAEDDSAWSDDAALEHARREVARVRSARWGSRRARLYEPVQRVKEGAEALEAACAELDLVPAVAALQEACRRIIAAATRRKREIGALDFTDMMLIARDLLTESTAVRVSEAAACRLLLVDEFQDTNRVQAELVEAIIDRADRRRRTFIVGDPKQSIYAFRGADVAVYERRSREALHQGAVEHPLTASWRSRPGVTELVNRISAELFRSGDRPLPDHAVHYDPRRDALSAIRRGAALPERPTADLVVPVPADGPTALLRARSARALAGYLRSLVAGDEGVEVHDSGEPGATESTRAPRFGDIAILLRTFSHLELLLRELRLAGVPALPVRGRGFDHAPEIRDLICWLRFALDPDDALAFAASLRSPLVGVADQTLIELAIGARASGAPRLRPERWLRPDAELPVTDHDDAQRVRHFLAACRWLRPRLDRLGPAATLEAALEWSDFEAFHAARPGGDQALANIRRLVDLAHAEQARGGDTAGFVRLLSQRIDRPTRTPLAEVERQARDQVRVLTVHASKGLQFPIVVLADLGHQERHGAGRLMLDHDAGFAMKWKPDRDSDAVETRWSGHVKEALRSRQEEESKRLFYVALTRARDHLVLAGEGIRASWRERLEGMRDALVEGGMLRVVEREVGPVTRDLETACATSAEAPEAPLNIPGPEPSFDDSAGNTPVPLRITTTGLELLLECPRRYRLIGVLGLEERPAGGEARRAEEGAADPRREGELSHAILERVDFDAAFADPDGEIERVAAGLDRADPKALEGAMAAAGRLLRGAAADELRRASVIEREVDFRLLLPGGEGRPPIQVRGRIDLVYRDSSGRWVVVDYKRPRRPAGGSGRHRTQLTLYVMAVEALEAAREGSAGAERAVEVGAALCYLGDAEPVLHPVEPDRELPARALRAVGELERWNGEQRWPGIERERCLALRCGFVERCHR